MGSDSNFNIFSYVAQWVEGLDFTQARQWTLSVIVLIFLLGVSHSVRKFLWKRLSDWTNATPVEWDDLLIKEIYLPVKVLFIVASIGMAGQLIPDSARTHPASIYSLKIALVLVGTWLFERAISVFFQTSQVSTSLSESTKTLLLTMGRLLFFSIALLIILDSVGISITPILASLGVGSVAIALAIQDTLSNFFSGLYILVDKPIEIGDFIRIEDKFEGYVTQIGWRSTHIRLLSNNTVVMPNSKVASAQLTNFNLPDKESNISVMVNIDYESDLEKVEKITLEVANEVTYRVPGAVRLFEPSVRYQNFGENGIQMSVSLRVAQFVDSYLLKHEFIKALHSRFKSELITIPYHQLIIKK